MAERPELPVEATTGLYRFARGLYEGAQRRSASAAEREQEEKLKNYPVFLAPGGGRYSNQYDPQKNPGAFISKLIEEVGKQDLESLPYSERVTQFDRPPVLQINQRGKSQQRMQTDWRQRQMLDRLLSAYGVPESPGVSPPGWGAIDRVYDPDTAKSLKDSLHAYVLDKDGYRSGLRSGMEDSGILGESAPLNTAMTWMQSMPAMLYGVGENVSDFFDPVAGEARDKARGDSPSTLRRAFNTFTAPLQVLNTEVPDDYSAWSSMKAARDEMDSSDSDFTGPHRTYDPQGTVNDAARYANLEREQAAGGLRLGEEYFRDTLRAPPQAAALLGATTDALFNPYFEFKGMAGAISALPKAKPLLRQLLTEFGVDYGILAANAMQSDPDGDAVRNALPKTMPRDWSR